MSLTKIKLFMKQTQSSVSSDDWSWGFTILELIVTMFLGSVMGLVVIQTMKFQSDTYRQDIARMRIQQNLRGALDIVAMNVRQAGEGLDKYFPALTLADWVTPDTNVLTLRRKTLPEVLVVCAPVGVGVGSIAVSDVASTTPECLPTNVASAVTAWTNERTAATGGKLKIYIYDRVGKKGEFLEYTGETTNVTGNNLVYVNGISVAYPARSTSLYVLEEYSFNLDATSKTLKLFINGDTTNPQDVAYKITQFHTTLRLQDGTTVTTLAPEDLKSWKDLRAVDITLSGEDEWRELTVNRSVKGEYFPRNILSR